MSSRHPALADWAKVSSARPDNVAILSIFFPILPVAVAALRSPHSHSMILDHGNALIFQRKFFLRTTKNHLPDPSESCALEFKEEFRRFRICSVSATIGIDRSIFCNSQ
jgi:hypothetical protein